MRQIGTRWSNKLQSTNGLITQGKQEIKNQIINLGFSISQSIITKKIKSKKHSPMMMVMMTLVIPVIIT